jgi:sarcosine oxidase subunit gamma
MVDQLSPLAPVYRPGSHGDFVDGVGVTLSETQPASIVQVAAWRGQEKALAAEILRVTSLILPDAPGGGVATEDKAGFGIAPGRFLVIDQNEGLAARLSAAVASHVGTVVDLSHGRTAIRIAGPNAEWILAKFFAIDFSLAAFPVGFGVATSHHDFLAQIQRTGPQQFDLYVFRSFARAFWTALCHASEEVGYEVR